MKTLCCFFPNIGGCLLPNPGEAIDYQDLRNVQVKGEFHLSTYHLLHVRQNFHHHFDSNIQKSEETTLVLRLMILTKIFKKCFRTTQNHTTLK